MPDRAEFEVKITNSAIQPKYYDKCPVNRSQIESRDSPSPINYCGHFAGLAARNVMTQKAVMPARSSATLC
jgi:hypothetical protein